MNLDEFLREWSAPGCKLLVHTSGSTGQPKALWVEKRRMEASARITCQFLGLKPGDTALLCLPLDYIAGKMMVVRALTCGLRLVSLPPSSHPLAQMDGGCEAVWSSLQVPQERQRLMGIRHLIIGGGAIDDALAAELKSFPNAVWSTYGMTETLSHIALRRLSGSEATEWYTPFSGVALALSSEGCLIIDAPLVCQQTLVTNDVAELLPDGRFRILGRRDNVVCSGGIKIQIEEVERLLKPHLAMPFCVTKRKDARLGEALVLLVQSPADIAPLQSICRRVLPRLWKPRRIIGVPRIPLTATGKIARQEAQRMAERE